MRKYYFLLILLGMSMNLFGQGTRISGKIVDALTRQALPSATVKFLNTEVKSNEDGDFRFETAVEGDYELRVSMQGYEPAFVPLRVGKQAVALGQIPLKKLSSENAEVHGLAEVTQSSLDFDDESKGQYISGILQSSEDIFNSTAAYTLSGAYFRIRGYDSEYSSVFMNNIFVNDMENGRPVWAEWGGLNDVTRNKEMVAGLGASDYSFGDVGGSTNIITRASAYRPQKKITYSLSNRGYTNRLMMTYSTGLMENNWAFTVCGSRRWAQEGYVKGTFYDAWAYFFAAEKKFNASHSLALTFFGSPTRRGMQAGATQEIYDLMNTNYYNPNWGYQNGEVRNAKVRKTHEPMIILNHYWTLSDKTQLTSSLGYSFGRYGTTALNWYNAADPRPDYYRYLPSYQEDTNIAQVYTLAWQNDPLQSQINWDKLYQVNYLSNLTNQQSRYIIEERRQDHKQLSLNILLHHEFRPGLRLTAGIDGQRYVGHRFKVLNDLLGGNYWLDIDQFSQRDFDVDTNILQNDLNHPNRIIKEGDKFGYDYEIHVNTASSWAQLSYNLNILDLYGAVKYSHTSLWRDGNMRNGRAPENSYGKSEQKDFDDLSAKAGATFKLTGNHFIVANAAYLSLAPFSQNAFLSQQIKATYAIGLKSEKVQSGDLSYVLRSSRIKARLTAYQTKFSDETKIMSFYHDDLLTYVNMSLTGIDRVHQGIEFGVDYKLSKTLNLIAVLGLGNFRYTSRPTAVVSIENGSVADTMETVYSKYFYVSGSPQNAGSVGVKYQHPKYWYFNANLNYFDKSYLDFNPERRTQSAIANLGEGDPMIVVITKQEKLTHGLTLDASLGKSIRYKKLFMNINFSVNNILDNQDLITGGYEQLRFDFETKDVSKFPPRYFYGYGRTFFLNINVRI